MAKSEFTQVASFASAAEAEQIRSVLAEHEVAAFVDGANSNTAMSYVGTALGGVKLFVRTEDADRARELIDSLGDADDEPGEPWFCGECQEEVDAGFETCWSCGRLREDAEQPFPNGVREVQDENEPAKEDPLPESAVTFAPASYDHANPYAAPQAPTTAQPPTAVPEDIDPEVEAMLLRAWRASILGLVFIPVLGSLYSMWLLMHASSVSEHFSPQGRKYFYRALAVNLFAGLGWSVFIWQAFQWPYGAVELLWW